MAEPARHLSVVEAVTTTDGEVLTSQDVTKLQAEVDKLRVNLKMAERDVRAKNRRINELERDKALERLEYERREDVVRIATYWHRKCRAGDKRVNPLSPARFDAVRGLLDMERVEIVDGKRRRVPFYELEAFKQAIDGAAYDHFQKRRKNGTAQHFDDLELICRDSKQFEEFRARAPR